MSRFSTYIRQNLLGLVAIFIALTMGTAYATHPGGENTISTEDIQNQAVTTSKIAAQAATTGKIAPEAVTRPKVADLAINAPKLAWGAVQTGKLADGAVTSDKLADDAVNTPKIHDGMVTNPKLATNAVTGAKVLPNTLTGTHVNEAALDYASAGCKTGLVHSFARIKGKVSSGATMPTTYTTSSTFVEPRHNCAGGSVEVRRTDSVEPPTTTNCCYFIRFNGDGAQLAVATSTFANRSIGLQRIFSGPDAGAFQVDIRRANTAGTDAVLDGDIIIMTF